MSHATPTYRRSFILRKLSIIANFHITTSSAQTRIKIIRSSSYYSTPHSSLHYPHHHTNHHCPVIASVNFIKSFRPTSLFLSCYVKFLHDPHHQSYFSYTATHITLLFICSKVSFSSFSQTHITSPSPHCQSCHTSNLKSCLSLGSLSNNEFVHPLHVFIRRHLSPATPSPITLQSFFSPRIGMRNTHSVDVDLFEL